MMFITSFTKLYQFVSIILMFIFESVVRQTCSSLTGFRRMIPVLLEPRNGSKSPHV